MHVSMLDVRLARYHPTMLPCHRRLKLLYNYPVVYTQWVASDAIDACDTSVPRIQSADAVALQSKTVCCCTSYQQLPVPLQYAT